MLEFTSSGHNKNDRSHPCDICGDVVRIISPEDEVRLVQILHKVHSMFGHSKVGCAQQRPSHEPPMTVERSARSCLELIKP